MEEATGVGEELLVVADFNIHVDCPSSLLEFLGLGQLGTERTHERSHMLDLFITRAGSSFMTPPRVTNLIRDHHLIISSPSIDKPKEAGLPFSFRNYRRLIMEDFVADLKSSSLLAIPAFYPGDLEATLTSQIGQYEELRAILDRHAPLQHKKAPTRPPSPWINDKILSARRALRKAERIWR